jgi:hypothetical protein
MPAVALHKYSPHTPALLHAVLNWYFAVAEANELGDAGDTASDSESRCACFESGPGKTY